MKKHLHKDQKKLAVLLLSPSFLLLLFIAFYPLFTVIKSSFTNKTFASAQQTQWVGFSNYKELLAMRIVSLPKPVRDMSQVEILEYLDAHNLSNFRPLYRLSLLGENKILIASDPDFIFAIKDTLSYTVISVFLELVLGMIVALMLVSQFRGQGFFRMAMLIPWAIPTAISSKMWGWMFAPSRLGVMNVIAQWFGFTDGQFPFLLNEASQLWVVIAIDVWKTTPFMALLLMAGLQAIPRGLYEAATVDGYSSWRQFWSITLPLVKPTIIVALIFRTLDALRVFDLFQIIFAQKRFSLASFTYYQLIDTKRMGYSSAAGMIIFLIIFLFTLIYMRMVRENIYD